MNSIGEFKKGANGLLGDKYNCQIDRAHARKNEHLDLTVRLPEISGVEKVNVDYAGNVIGGINFYWQN